MNKIKDYNNNIFEDIKRIDEEGNEYWHARELMSVLEYKQWRRFEEVIKRAMIACSKTRGFISLDFAEVGKIIKAGATTKKIKDYNLSRYACYLIVQNGDPRKNVIALGQSYFAIKTHMEELNEAEYKYLTENEKRLYRRIQTANSNKALYKIAGEKGVKNFDRFTNAGYKGLYNGETADDIAKRKGLRYREEILDNMGSAELGANIFRITQTESILDMQKEKNEKLANETHYKVGKEVRNAMKRIGSIMPEKLPTPDKSIKELKKEELKNISGGYSDFFNNFLTKKVCKLI